MPNIKKFWTELRRRKVVRVAIVYAVVAWALIEGAYLVFPELLLPEWTSRLVLVLALAGFPIALVLAWAFEISPDGVLLTPPAKFNGGATPVDDVSKARPSEIAAEPLPGRRAIAVLPLVNMSGDPENEFFSDGISEEIISLLARLPDLRVVSRTSSFSFKGTDLDVRSIAAKLDVNIVLEGSVRRVGNRVRVVAQLIDAANDNHLWSDSYDRELEDIFAVQTDIARRVVDAMNLSSQVRVRSEAPTDSIPAYDYYLRGRQYFYQQTGKSLYWAREMFNKAIEIDPGYGKAYAGAAFTASMIAQWFDCSPRYLREADETSRTALTVTPDLAEAHAARGYALSMNGEYVAAAEHFERAIRLDPQLYESWYLYGRSRFAEGNLEEAIRLWAKAHAVRPEEYQSAALRVQALKALGRSEEAKSAAEEAVNLTERHLALNPDDVRALYLGAGAMIEAGRPSDGLAMIERAIKLEPDDPSVLQNAACTYAHAGDGEKALDLLERRLQEGGTMYRDWLEHDTDYDLLRNHPRFMSILERLPSARGR